MEKRIDKSYTDFISEMYYDPSVVLKPNESLTRNVTFQVTDSCDLNCKYCLTGDTEILMADLTTKPIKDVVIGDKVLGVEEYRNGSTQERLYEATVLNKFEREAETLNITCENGNSINITPNHKVLNRRNNWNNCYDWKEAGKLKPGQDMYYTKIVNPVEEYTPPVFDDNYKIGYVVGMFKGDGSVKKYLYTRPDGTYYAYKIRLAVKDMEIIYRTKNYLDYLGIETYTKKFLISKKYNIYNDAIFANTEKVYNQINKLYDDNFLKNTATSYYQGFLAGIYDAEGSLKSGKGYCIRITNTDPDIIKEIENGLKKLEINYVVENAGRTINKEHKWTIRIADKNNIDMKFKFLKSIENAIQRKSYYELKNRRSVYRTKVVNIQKNESITKVYNIETTTRTYVANGFIVHNCYQQNKGKRFMSKETARKAVDLLFKMYYDDDGEFINKKTKAIILDFIGGEPLLAIDIIDYVCTYFVKKCLELNHPWLYTWRASMTTNGTHYFSDCVQNFLKKFGDNISFSITIDGPKEIHDSCRIHKDGRGNFDEAYAAMKHYNANYKSELGTKVTIAPENLKEINRIVNFFIGEGIKIIHANCVFEEKWNLEQAQIFYKELKLMADTLLKLNDETTVSLFTEKHFGPLPETENKPYCGGAGRMLAFDPDGKAYPCVRYMESSLGKDIEPLVIGSVDGLFVRKEEQNIKLMLDSIDRRTESDDECYYCPIASGCSYCVAYNYQSGGLPIRRNKNICLMHKARSLANVYYWNKWYKLNNIKSTFYMHLPKEDAVEIIGEDEYNMLVELSK